MKSAQEEQRERKALAGSTTEVTTYRDRAIADIGLEQSGRHSTKARVVGSVRVPQYPAASGPWNDPVQVPPEPPLGYAINAQESVGEVFEVLESLAAQPTDSLTSGGAAAPSALLPLAAEGAPSLLRRARRL
jgi:hypothetical protein